MGARIHKGQAHLLTRSGLDWTDKYPSVSSALRELPMSSAYIDGVLRGVRPDGIPSFSLIQAATERGAEGHLVYYAFDLLFIIGEAIAFMPLIERKERLKEILAKPPRRIMFSAHFEDDGETVRKSACAHGLEGAVSKRTDRPYLPGNPAFGPNAKASTGLNS